MEMDELGRESTDSVDPCYTFMSTLEGGVQGTKTVWFVDVDN